MYIPKSKYKVKSTPGREFEDSKGNTYVGSVITLYTGKSYAGTSPSDLGKELFALYTFRNKLEATDIELMQEYPKPTERDYTAGTYVRYFLIDRRDSKIYEVGKTKYANLKSSNFVNRASVNWNLTGPVEDTKVGDYIYPGTGTKNQQIIDQLERAVPGFKDFLSAEQFVR